MVFSLPRDSCTRLWRRIHLSMILRAQRVREMVNILTPDEALSPADFSRRRLFAHI